MIPRFFFFQLNMRLCRYDVKCPFLPCLTMLLKCLDPDLGRHPKLIISQLVKAPPRVSFHANTSTKTSTVFQVEEVNLRKILLI